MKCNRCESVGREVPNVGIHKLIGPNGVKTLICDQCLEELDNEDSISYHISYKDEIEDDEEVY